MLIIPYHKYRIICRHTNRLIHEWNLQINPNKRSWKLANTFLVPGMLLHGYQILSVEEIISLESDFMPLESAFHPSNGDCPHCNGDLFDFVCSDCDFDFRDIHKETCPFCHGSILNDRCLDCHFDFDN